MILSLDLCEYDITREKELMEGSDKNLPFKHIAGSRAMPWIFQSVKCMDMHLEQDDRRKSCCHGA